MFFLSQKNTAVVSPWNNLLVKKEEPRGEAVFETEARPRKIWPVIVMTAVITAGLIGLLWLFLISKKTETVAPVKENTGTPSPKNKTKGKEDIRVTNLEATTESSKKSKIKKSKKEEPVTIDFPEETKPKKKKKAEVVEIPGDSENRERRRTYNTTNESLEAISGRP